MRATDIIQRMVYENNADITEFALKCGFRHPENIYKTMQREDVMVATLYKICKTAGYQLIVFNPKEKVSYLINSEKEPMKGKAAGIFTNKYSGYYVKGEYVIDKYTCQKVRKPYRPKRRNKTYRKQVKFVQVKPEEMKEGENGEE